MAQSHPREPIAVFEPLAVVGLACRFPGGATCPDAFWALLRDGVDAITEVPPERWSLSAHYSADRSRPGKTYARHGGFLKHIDRFDAAFFGISPREAMQMDPQQRLALELAWEAFEDAGYDVATLAGSLTSVYVGITLPEYNSLQVHPDAYPLIDAHTGTGLNFSIVANRISYNFDLRGPSVAVDTACSGSLVAVHHACNTIWHDGCSLALAGGVNLNLKPDTFVMHSKASMLSPTGRCHAFDARADGFVRSEGGGLVVLKPLSAAQRDGDRIRAVIRSTSVNQDGRTVSITMPNRDAQIASIQAALRQAAVEPHQIQYVEAHGPGTPVGDPIEAEAIGTALSPGRAIACVVGSVKTNIGHLEAASGAAGLIKLILSLQHRQIPANLHFESPNPRISLDALKLRIPTALEPWPSNLDEAPRLAGINSFGFGGTNAHAILSEPPLALAESRSSPGAERSELLVLSARSDAALAELGQAQRRRLADTDVCLSDLCWSALARRSHHPCRLAVVGSTPASMRENLQAILDGQTRFGTNLGRAEAARNVERPVFVFSGMGQQWPRMGRRLLEHEEPFRAVVQACEAELAGHIDWSLSDVLSRGTLPIDRTEIAQVAIFAVQIGLYALWRDFGVEPGAVVGHSVGEVAAAHVAGALSLSDALMVVLHRSRLQAATAGHGRMLAVGLGPEDVQPWLHGHEADVSIAAVNSPRSVTLAGDNLVLDAIAAHLTQASHFNRFLKVEVPYHSPLMEPLMEPLRAALARLRPERAKLKLLSTVTGELVDGPELNADYWAQNIRRPVVFARAIAALHGAGHRLFIEVSAHPVLGTALKECTGVDAKVLASLRRDRDERECLLATLGELYCLGWPLDAARLFPAGGRYVSLPGYPWQRASHWQEAEATRLHRLSELSHPLLGRRLRQPYPAWEGELDLERLAYLTGHRIQGEVVFPYTAYCEMAMAAAREVFGTGGVVLSSVGLDRALILEPSRSVKVRLELTPDGTGFSIHSLLGRDWIRHVHGKLALLPKGERPPPLALETIRKRCPKTLSGAQCYRELSAIGYAYGPTFQGIERLWYGPAADVVETVGAATEALYELRWPSGVPLDAQGYYTHPAVVDAYLNGVLAVLMRQSRQTWIPIHTEESIVYEPPDPRAWMHMQLVHCRDSQLELNLLIADELGRICVAIRGMQYRALATDSAGAVGSPSTFEEFWQTAPPAEAGRTAVPAGRWLILDDRIGRGLLLAEHLEALEGQAVRLEQDPASDGFGIELQRLGPFDEVIHLRNLVVDDEPTTAILHGSESVLGVARALANLPDPPRLWLVTCGVQSLPGCIAQPHHAPIWGLGRVLCNELPTLRVRMVDLHSGNDTEISALGCEIGSGSAETEVALCNDTRYVRRLRSLPLITSGAALPFRLAIRNPGSVDGLLFEAMPPHTPGPGQVSIEVVAAGLNFKDVVKALNLIDEASLARTYAGRSLGLECAGRILALGAGVTGLRPGDEVIAIAQHCFATCVVTEATMVVPKPATMTFDEAAACPVVYMTAYAALRHFGRLEAGERVLIHTAAGGVGQAALQIARHLGAEIYATAGSEEKRAWLRAQGVAHVGDSRSLTFASELLAATGGEGVDLVLNTLPARTLQKSLSILRPRGRLIDLSNFYSDAQVDMRPFQKGLSLIAFDLDQLMLSDATFISALLRESLQFVFENALPAPPCRSFTIAAAKDAFRHLAQGQNVGKVVLTLQQPEAVAVDATTAPQPTLCTNATYLVTGGTSGFGLSTARWLVERGAGHVALLSRHGVSSAEAEVVVAELRQTGANIVVLTADVGDRHELNRAISEVRAQLPPLRGIIHAAAVYGDGLLLQMTPADLQRVFLPKAVGAWNLHQATHDLALDFFVLYSSVAATLGNPGQANYSAANSFLDTLAEHRQSRGLPATSVAFGGIADVGYLARERAISTRLEQTGLALLTPQQALTSLGVLLRLGVARAIVAPIEWQAASERLVALGSPRFEAFVTPTNQPGSNGRSLTEELARCEPAARVFLLGTKLAEQAARILGIAATSLDPQAPLTQLGLDSLMAVELSQALKQRLGLELSSMRLLSGDSLLRIAEGQLAAVRAPDTATTNPPADVAPSASTLPALTALERRTTEGAVPLSFQQLAMWHVERSNPRRGFYNLPTLARLRGSLDVDALRWAYAALVGRQEALRFTFVEQDGQTCLRFADECGCDLPVEDLRTIPQAARESALAERWNAEQTRPFNLTRESGLRAQLLIVGEQDAALIVVLHHVAADGASFPIFFGELYELYRAKVEGRAARLPELSIRYGDFALWQHRYFAGECLEAWVTTSRRLLGAPLPAPQLPTDYPRPEFPSRAGARCRFSLHSELSHGLSTLGREGQATLFVTLLTALGMLVHRYSGQLDFNLGTFMANRSRPELSGVVGCFVNQVPIRINLEQNPSFMLALGRVRAATLQAHELAELPFALLTKGGTTLYPLPVVLILHTELESSSDHRICVRDGLIATHLEGENRGAKRDWTFHLFENPTGLSGYLEYDTDLYERAGAERVVQGFISLLEQIVRDPDMALSTLVAAP